MGKKNELKQGNKKFKFLGRVNMDSKGTNIRIAGTADSGYVYNSMKLMLNLGDGNTAKVETFGGHFPKDHKRETLLYLNKKDWSDGQIKLDFFDRHNDKIMEQIKEKIGNDNYYVAGMEFGKGDNYPVTKKFLSEYDLIAYVNEHLKDGDIVSVSGTIEPNVYQGNITDKYNIEYISKRKESALEKNLDEGQTVEDLFYAKFERTLYFTRDSVGRKDKETGLIPVTGYSYDYLGKVDGNDFKKKKIVPLTFWLESDKMKKYLTPSRDKVNKLTVDGHIVNKSKEKKLTFDELDDDVKELVNDGLLTKEDAIGKATVYGGFESKRYIDMITIYNSEKDGVATQSVQYDKNYLDDDTILYGELLDIDEPEEADLNEDYEDENDDVVESVTGGEEDDDISDVLKGL